MKFPNLSLAATCLALLAGFAPRTTGADTTQPPTIQNPAERQRQLDKSKSENPPSPVSLTIDTRRAAQEILGFGASGAWWAQEVGAWPEAERRALVNLLYDKTTGIGLDIYRHNIGADTMDDKNIRVWQRRAESLLDTKTGRFDWSRDASARRVLRDVVEAGAGQVILFVNSPPVSMTINGRGYLDKNTEGEGKRTNLAPERYADFAAYLGEVTEHFARVEKMPVVALSPVNEPEVAWDTPKQEGCYYTPQQTVDVLKAVDAELKRRKLPVRLEGPENSTWDDALKLKYFQAINRDPVLRDTLKDFCLHSYWEQVTNGTGSSVAAKRRMREWLDKNQPGARLHMSEWCQIGDGKLGERMDGAMLMLRLMMEDIGLFRVSTWQWWLAATYKEYRDGLIHYDSNTRKITLTKRYWVMGQFSRNLPKGSVVLGMKTDESAAKVMAFAARRPDGSVVVICANFSREDRTLDIHFPADEKWEAVSRSITNDRYSNGVSKGDAGGALPARSLVAIVFRK